MITDLVPSVSIENLVAKRNAAAERIRAAHKLLTEANDLNKDFLGGGDDVYEMWRMRLVEASDRSTAFTDDDGADRQIKRMDAHYWDALLKRSGLMTFMDAEAREKWNKNISDATVPELTDANIKATFESLYATRGEMFERGVITAFRRLSWDFKSNSAVKLGKKIILTRVVNYYSRDDKYGSPDHDACNKLDDLVRVMLVLDGKPEPDHRDGAYYTLQGGADGSYAEKCAKSWPGTVNPKELHGVLSLRGFRNGNAHVTFLRPGLVDKLNHIIAKHYPNALPPSRDCS